MFKPIVMEKKNCGAVIESIYDGARIYSLLT